ncbi:MAG: hypothetical protein ACLRXC_06555 [[Clostridium] leptum]
MDKNLQFSTEKTITHEMAAEWIKGALQKYEKYTIEDGVVKDSSFEEFKEIAGWITPF